MDTSKIVGEKIKALREDKTITIEELAQRSGLAIEQIERIESFSYADKFNLKGDYGKQK